ncbi:MAG: hypothetical protein ACI8ZB_002211 [Desulforhopalus sp.]|jgi:hypothetical protein
MTLVKKIAAAASGTALICSLGSTVYAGGVDESMLLELKKLIEQQQKQLDNQASQIAELKEQLGGTSQAVEKKVDKEEVVSLGVDKMVTSKTAHVDVNLYGHLNRGVLWSDNGDSSKVSFVDNSNSQSRLGLNAAVFPSEDFTVGGKIEYGIKSNASTDVSGSETNGVTSDTWNLRQADIFFVSNTYGKVSIGHGSAASDGTAEVDLSGTSVVSYSDVGALSGGQFFYDADNDTLSEFRVKNIYNNIDGLGRDDRLRYDSPAFSGFTLSGSAVSGDAFDTALTYSRAYGDTKVAAAVAWADPADTNTSVDNQYDGSMSVLLGNGLNATVSAGLREMNEDGRDDATNWYGKLGYRVDICSLGTTSLSVDYGESADISNEGETGKTWSVAAVQDIPSWSTEFYLAFRNYSLDSDIESYDDVNAVLGGARVKF